MFLPESSLLVPPMCFRIEHANIGFNLVLNMLNNIKTTTSVTKQAKYDIYSRCLVENIFSKLQIRSSIRSLNEKK